VSRAASAPDANEELTRPIDLKAWALLIALGLATRLLVLFLINPVVVSDSLDYIARATAHASGTLRPIGYPAFIAAPYALGGAWAVYAVQSALTIGVAIATHHLLRRHGLLAAILIVTSPFLALYDVTILSESFCASMVWLAWLLLQRQPLVSAGLLAWAVLSRETLALLPLCAFPFVARRYWPAFAAAALFATPVLMESPRGGLTLWVGTWERNPSWFDRTGLAHPQFPTYAFTSEQERAAVMRTWPNVPTSIALQRIASRPLATARTWLIRYPQLWLGTRSEGFFFRAERGSPLWLTIKIGLYGLNLGMLALGLWGLWRNPRFAVPVLYVALIQIPFHAEARYTHLAIPFLLYGVAGQLSLLAREPRRAFSRRSPATGEA